MFRPIRNGGRCESWRMRSLPRPSGIFPSLPCLPNSTLCSHLPLQIPVRALMGVLDFHSCRPCRFKQGCQQEQKMERKRKRRFIMTPRKRWWCQGYSQVANKESGIRHWGPMLSHNGQKCFLRVLPSQSEEAEILTPNQVRTPSWELNELWLFSMWKTT